MWGVGAGMLYLAAAVWVQRGGMLPRVLYDGVAPPPPYRWVRPPARLAPDNQPPEAGAGSIALRGGSEYASVGTGDGQAFAIFPPGAIAASGNEPAARITLTPLDPATIGPPPEGMRLDGNAYRIAGTYAVSHHPVVLRGPVTVVLRYPTRGTSILRSTDDRWIVLRSINVHMGMQSVAESDRFGVFIAAAPVGGGPLAFLAGWPTGLLVALGAALVLVLLIGLKMALRPGGHRAAEQA